MRLTPVDPRHVRRSINILLAVSIIAAAVHFPFRSSVYVRGPFGALGLLSSWLGFGIALWSAVRLRDRAFAKAFLVAAVVFAYWAWQLYDAVIGRYN